MSCGGIDAGDAIGRLLGMYAEATMDLEKMSVIDSEASDDHLECRVPHINLWRFPIATSENCRPS